MAGIGVRLNNLFQKNTLTTDLLGFFYSTVVTVAPMLSIWYLWSIFLIFHRLAMQNESCFPVRYCTRLSFRC